MIGRGGLSEISTYMDELEVKTEFSQGAAQLCPVGNLNVEAGNDFSDAELDEIEALMKNTTPQTTSSSAAVPELASL